MTKKISIIVPVYNEEENIASCYAALKQVTDKVNELNFEFVFTDNCSTDNSFEILKQMAKKNKNIKVLRLSKNFGYQRSIWTGYKNSTGDAAIEIDCDLQDPPELILDFISYWNDGYKVVYGIREARSEGFFVTQLRRLYYRLLGKISMSELPNDAGDFMLIDRVIIDNLVKIKDPNLYIRGLVFSFGYPRHGIAYKRLQRKYGQSKFPISKLIRLASDGIVSQSTTPLRFGIYLGASILLITLLLMTFYIFLWTNNATQVPPGFTTLVLLLLTSISVNAILLGVFGEYLARLYDMAQNKPMSIIEKGYNLNKGKESRKKSNK